MSSVGSYMLGRVPCPRRRDHDRGTRRDAVADRLVDADVGGVARRRGRRTTGSRACVGRRGRVVRRACPRRRRYRAGAARQSAMDGVDQAVDVVVGEVDGDARPARRRRSRSCPSPRARSSCRPTPRSRRSASAAATASAAEWPATLNASVGARSSRSCGPYTVTRSSASSPSSRRANSARSWVWIVSMPDVDQELGGGVDRGECSRRRACRA